MSEFDIRYVARLARVALTAEEEQKLGAQLGLILGYIAKLKEVDVDGIEPMAHAVPLVNVTREDVVTVSMGVDAALRTAPAQSGDFFVVPKIVE